MSDPLHTAELEAKVQTYQHIDKIREMLRLFANELVTRGETHDRSKLAPEESKVYAEFTPKLKTSTYGSEEYKGFLRDMKPALDHHYVNNRHHPEHHFLGVGGMNLLDVLEMWIDWYCSSMRHADGDMGKSITINEKRFGMSPQLVAIFHNTLQDLKEGTLSSNRPQLPACTMECHLVAHMTGGLHRTDCAAYEAHLEAYEAARAASEARALR